MLADVYIRWKISNEVDVEIGLQSILSVGSSKVRFIFNIFNFDLKIENSFHFNIIM